MPNKNVEIRTVLVPAGAEYQAVRRGLKRVQNAPQLLAIPAGPQGVKTFLETESVQAGGVLLMGLGGSLSPGLNAGDGVMVEQVWNELGEVFASDRMLTAQISERLQIAVATGVTCDRIITTAAEKKALGDRYRASVVEMEGAVLLAALPDRAIAILRVISDDCRGDLPDMEGAIAADGSLRPVYLALSFAKRPLAAIRLVRGSLKGLKALENLTFALF